MERLSAIARDWGFRATTFLAWCVSQLSWALFLAWRPHFMYPAGQRLGTTKIRLLRPLANHSLSLVAPSLTLETFDTANLPAYVTLSYTWGPAQDGDPSSKTPEKTIVVNNRRFDVFPNLYDALCQLARSGETNLIWIDAICINQTDKAECSAQVSIMDTVYKNATKTIVWLGRETARTARAAQLLAGISPIARKATLGLLESSTWADEVNLKDPAALDKYGMPRLSAEDWAALSDVFGRRYIGRVWMIQELALSRQVEVRCGSLRLDWQHVGDLSAFLLISNCLSGLLLSSPKPTVPQMLICRGAPRALALHIARLWCTGEDPALLAGVAKFNWTASMDDASGFHGVAFFKLLTLTTSFAATNIKDRIFSHYGLVKHMIADKKIKWYYHPNYKLSDAEVFTNFARGIIEETGRLSLLTYAGDSFPPSVVGLPSWVPDFSTTNPGGKSGIYRTDSLRAVNASGPLGDALCLHVLDGPRMFVRAIEVGRVVAVGETWADIMQKRQFTMTAEMLYHHIAPTYPYTNQPRTEALWRTLLSDQDLTHRPAAAEVGPSFRSWIAIYIFARIRDLLKLGVTLTEASLTHMKLDAIAQAEAPADRLFPTWLDTYERLVATDWVAAPVGSGWRKAESAEAYSATWVAQTRRFETLFFHAMQDRRSFATTYGHLACGPRTTVLGDSVCIVAGCPSPLIMRRAAGGDAVFRVIGEAYVHGIMNGEAVSESVTWQDICLC